MNAAFGARFFAGGFAAFAFFAGAFLAGAFLAAAFFAGVFVAAAFFAGAFFAAAFLAGAFFAGTLPPSARASDSPIAIACFGFVTFLPEPPLLRLPCFISSIARSTFSPDFLP